MIGGIQNIGRIPELRQRILFTFGMLAVYRVGCAVVTPGINAVYLAFYMILVSFHQLMKINMRLFRQISNFVPPAEPPSRKSRVL